MFPCIGQMVVHKTDEQTHKESWSCALCGKVLTGPDHNLAVATALCPPCHDRFMTSMPRLTQ
jgi:transcription elongation factor Elf1